MWLVMPTKQRLRFCHISPLRKTLTPPLVIFWNRVELRKIKGYDFCQFIHGQVVFSKKHFFTTANISSDLKTLTPPLVIFWNRVELRKIKGYDFCQFIHGQVVFSKKHFFTTANIS